MVLVAAAAFLFAGRTAGATFNWTLGANQAGDWSVASNWSAKVPGSVNYANIVNGGTSTITLPGAACYQLALGNSTASGNVVMASGQL